MTLLVKASLLIVTPLFRSSTQLRSMQTILFIPVHFEKLCLFGFKRRLHPYYVARADHDFTQQLKLIPLNGVRGRKTNPLKALVNIFCFNGQMASRCYPIAALFTCNSMG